MCMYNLISYKIIVVAILLIIFCAYSCSNAMSSFLNVPTGKEAHEASGIVAFISKSHNFNEKSQIHPERPPVYHTPGHKRILGCSPHIISIYTIININEQNTIIALIKKYKVEYKTLPINLEFYEKENWIVKSTKRGKSGRHGHENLLKVVEIK